MQSQHGHNHQDHCAGGAGGGLLRGGTTTPGLPTDPGVPGVPGCGPGAEPQPALGGTVLGAPVWPKARPDGGRFIIDLCAPLLVRLQRHKILAQLRIDLSSVSQH